MLHLINTPVRGAALLNILYLTHYIKSYIYLRSPVNSINATAAPRPFGGCFLPHHLCPRAGDSQSQHP